MKIRITVEADFEVYHDDTLSNLEDRAREAFFGWDPTLVKVETL